MFRSVYFFFFVFMPLVSSLPTGAPEEACDTMAPGPPHRADGMYSTQMNASPYRLSISSEIYMYNGGPVRVTLDSPAGLLFKGFLVRAFDNNYNAIGRMELDLNSWDGNTQVRCSGYGVTHTNNNTKTAVQFFWYPPLNDTGAIFVTFTATVVQSFHVWWERATFSQAIYPSRQSPVSASSVGESCILLTLLCSLMVLMLTNGHQRNTMDITYL